MQGQTIEGENVSLRAEVERLREREAASREILGVIGLNRSDERPVLDAITQNAVKLCDATGAGLWLSSAARDVIRLASVAATDKTEFPVGMEAERESISPMGRCMHDARTINVADIRDDPYYLDGDPTHIKMIDEVGIRSRLIVPLVANGIAFGCISLIRKEVRSFSDDEVTLIESFAEQAVIAIENVRQFCEVQTRLEREAASAEILQVLSESRSDDEPVFKAILGNAARLCGARLVTLTLVNEARTHLSYVTHWGTPLTIFQPGVTEWTINSPTAMCEVIREASIVHVADLVDSDLYRAGDETRVRVVDEEGVRAMQAVPLMQGGQAIGAIGLHWSTPKVFSESEAGLIRTFAEQAVIAIENVRQFREVQERLEREIATGQILGAISRSRADTAPIFEEILESAARLCRAPMAWLLLLNSDRSELQLAAYHGPTRRALKIGQSWPLTPDRNMTGLGQALINALTVQDEDLTQVQGYLKGEPDMVQLVDEEGLRTRVSVPLVREGQSIGAIVLSRREVSRFSNEDVRLADTFAAQAVIAIENVRQFRALETLNAELGDRVKAQVGEIERMGRLKRFLPSAVADAVVTTGDESMLSSHRALVATLFCDLRGFTAFCESAEPEETIEVLQTYHQEMSVLIDQHGGGVDQRAGDGIMVIFNDPIPVDDPAGDAIRLALAMRTKMRALCADWKKLGHRLGFGVGISFGYATVGIVGSAGRFDYTASGTSINTAARLCDMAANDEILISPRTWAAVEGTFEAESRGEVEMKGIREPVEVFAVLSE
ncbi:GAF domain-containing protein [Sulfitobacter sp. JBTF-M27]|uniref:GAF domain-containing protein n=1 Tax=Sulfitobacter sediminilitoris TaxID=2698830 RepID=A0A6P0CE93_9RHOB|nr:GAF domain-containing protein [Sulfitobacter sediminilitoris]NEK24502.1 GAF domain-containing protein [Sulfitobacter sediminilitoris]